MHVILIACVSEKKSFPFLFIKFPRLTSSFEDSADKPVDNFVNEIKSR